MGQLVKAIGKIRKEKCTVSTTTHCATSCRTCQQSSLLRGRSQRHVPYRGRSASELKFCKARASLTGKDVVFLKNMSSNLGRVKARQIVKA